MENNTIKRPQVLLVEDDEQIIEIYKNSFGVRGINCEATGGVEDTMKKIVEENWQPDVILLDMILVGTNGIEVLENLKKNEKTKDIPVVVFTNLEDESLMKKSLEMGAVECLMKNEISHDDLAKKIRKISKKINVLFIEDDSDQVALYKMQFDWKGIGMDWAKDKKEALEKLKNEYFDLVFLDIVLGEENGLDILEEIRKTEGIKEIPVVVFTNFKSKETNERIAQIEILDYVIKSQVDPKDMTEKIREFVETGKWRKGKA